MAQPIFEETFLVSIVEMFLAGDSAFTNDTWLSFTSAAPKPISAAKNYIKFDKKQLCCFFFNIWNTFSHGLGQNTTFVTSTHYDDASYIKGWVTIAKLLIRDESWS